MSKEAKFFASLLPSHPEIFPIIQSLRDKYSLREIELDIDPISEIYLGDEIVPLENLRQEVKSRILENLDIFPPDIAQKYRSFKAISQTTELKDLDGFPNQVKEQLYALVNILKEMVKPTLIGLEGFIDNVVNMIYTYLLTGETEEVPSNWFSIVTTTKISDELVIFATMNQAANLDTVIQQLRAEYKKNFGEYRPAITKTAVSTAYYLQLKRQKKPWRSIVEEYIEREKIKLPRDRSSKRYADVWRRCEEKLKKRIQRTETIFDVFLRDKI